MAGPPPTNELEILTKTYGIEHQVEWIHYPNNDQITNLYKNASIFLFPSKYEGFGWPPLEAMANQCPVVCSNAASLPEVVGEAALTTDYNDYDNLAKHCNNIINNEDIKTQLIKKGNKNLERFTLDIFANKINQIYKSLLKNSCTL